MTSVCIALSTDLLGLRHFPPLLSRRCSHPFNVLSLQRWTQHLLPPVVHPLDSDVPVHVPCRKRIPLLARMNGVEVWIWHLAPFDPVVSQQADVAMAHDGLPQHLDAVLKVAFDDAC